LKEEHLYILRNEVVIYKKGVLNDYIEAYFIGKWDIRKIINEIQGNVTVEGELICLQCIKITSINETESGIYKKHFIW